MTIQEPGSARNNSPGRPAARPHLNIDTPAVLRRLMPFLILAVTVAVVSSQVPGFFSTGNLTGICRQTSFISLLVLGQTFVLIYGGFDLSVGSLFAVAGVLAAYGSHASWPVALLLPLGFGLASGLVNGLLIGKAGMAPFIVTLAELLGYGALVIAITHQGQVINVRPHTFFTQLATGSAIFGIDNLIVIMVAAYIIGAVVLNRTRYGASLFAVGGSQDSARMLGVPVIRTVITTYMISGALAALGGALFAAYSGTGQPTVGSGYELQSIAAAVVGGCVLGGGAGTISGPLAGALILGTIQDFVNLDPHFNAYTQNIVYGAFVVVVVVIQQALSRRQGARREERAARRPEPAMTEAGPIVGNLTGRRSHMHCVRSVVARMILAAAVPAVLLAGAALGVASSAAGVSAAPGLASPPASPYPQVGPGTHFLDDAALLAGMSQPGWYEGNIPFLSVPDQALQSVYYYRWRVWKEHLQQTQPGTGQIVTEFLPGIGYAAPFNGIVAASGHQIMEGRWVRDQSYDNSDLQYWLTGPGLETQAVNPSAQDWADEYSNWLVYAAWEQALVTGDMSSLKAMEPALISQYDSWSGHVNQATGLYWQLPVWDAMEQSASSYSSSDSYAGVQTLRPTINAYQYGAAEVISQVAAMLHQAGTAREFAAKAAALKAGVQRYLWSDSQQFFNDVLLPGNPSLSQLDQRQETGFVPWYFDMPQPSDSVAWSQLMDPQGFYAPYGPTTLEARSPLYMHDASTPGAYDGGCCHWDGPSWPYATSQTLTGLANLLDDYPAQNYITAANYDTLLENYAATQMKNGSPYVAEAHDPSSPTWIYDQSSHSEDYNHSTFNDLVISGLMGLRPQPGNTLAIKPLVPASWSYFVLENVPYHGHNVTLLYDQTGTRYNQGPGFHVYVDGRQVAWAPGVHDLTITIPATGSAPSSAGVFVDDTVNTTGSGYPMPSASHTWQFDSVWNAVDGKVWYDEIPEVDTRWTNYQSPNAADDLAIDMGASIPIDEVRFYSYCDGGGIQDAAGYLVQYWTGSAWADIPGQSRTPAAPACNDLNRVVFPPVTTSQVRLVLTNPPGHYVGVTELEAGSWASTAARLALGPPAGQSLPVTPGQPATVTAAFTNASNRPETLRSATLDLPTGWTAAPGAGASGPGVTVRPRAAVHLTWTVTPSAGAQPGGSYAMWAYADFSGMAGQRLQTQAEARAQVAFTLAPFTDVGVNDNFTSNDLAGYTQIQPAVTASSGEVEPAWTIGGGQAQASASQPWFGMLQSGTAPASDRSVVIVDPAKLLGNGKSQDSVFVGLAKDASNYVMAWYNNVYHTSGFDLVQNGVLEPAGFQSYCCANVTVNAGDRFALQVSGNTITSWVQPGGTGAWKELLSTTVAPLLDLTNPALLSTYHFTFGLRGDSGTMTAARLEGASDTS